MWPYGNYVRPVTHFITYLSDLCELEQKFPTRPHLKIPPIPSSMIRCECYYVIIRPAGCYITSIFPPHRGRFSFCVVFPLCLFILLLSFNPIRMQETPLRLLTDAIYDEFVAPNPYQPQRRVSHREYQQVVDALVGNFVTPNFETPPPEVLCVDVACQVPPTGAPSPIAPLHSPVQPIRRAPNTVWIGILCASCAFLPHIMLDTFSILYDVSPFATRGGGEAR